MFSLTWPASMQMYWNKRKRLHEKRVELPEDWFGTPTWPPFHCFGTPIWPPWRHVKTLYTLFHLCIRKPVNTPYTGMFRLCHEVLFSACYNLRISLIELFTNSIAVIENEIMAAVTSGLLTIVKTGITIVRCFGNVTTSLFALTIGRNFTPLWSKTMQTKGLFTWSGGPRSSGVGFFCFHALGDTKQKKLTPLDQGPPLHVNRV